MEIGLIKWFNDERRFGVLKASDSKEVFLHHANWADHQEISSDNKVPVFFDSAVHVGKVLALNCKYFDASNIEHWDKIFSLKECLYSISVNSVVLNLLDLAVSKISDNFDFSHIKPSISENFNKLTVDDLLHRDAFVYDLYFKTQNKNFKNYLYSVISARINKLDNGEVINFWKQKIVPEFIPNKEILISRYQEIGIAEIARLQDIETKNLIIVKKITNLCNEFTVTEFINFQKIVELIESDNLRKKVLKDLNALANSHYLPILTEDIVSLTVTIKSTYNDFNQFIGKLPKFLTVGFIDNVSEILKATIIQNCSVRTIIDCWQADIIEQLSESTIKLVEDKKDLIYLLSCKKCNENIVIKVFDRLLADQEFETLLNYAQKHNSQLFEVYDELVYQSATQEQYYELWRNKKGKITPLSFVNTYLNHQEERYSELKEWVRYNLLSNEKVNELLLSNIKKSEAISDRYDFYQVYYSVKFLIDIGSNINEFVKSSESSNLSLIIWHLKKEGNFDFDTLKGKFIYFKPEDQVEIFKRLFYLKHIGQIDFDLKKIDEILRADIDLYLLNDSVTDDFVLDISTHILIEAMKAFIVKGSFVFESDLILKDLQKNGSKKFKIDHYFDKCEGRSVPIWKSYYNLVEGKVAEDWRDYTEGRVSQVFYDDTFYYAIEFEKVKVTVEKGDYSEYISHRRNSNFDNLLNKVRSLPKSKWNPTEKHWGVPLAYGNEVFEFAKQNKFFIDLNDGLHYDNNKHLVDFSRTIKVGEWPNNRQERNIPNGIVFCEGRQANKNHKSIKKEFWWCTNQECFENCSTSHVDEKISNESSVENWEKYTLLDFLKILNIDVDEHKGMDLVENGHYHTFLGHINAFNRLLDRLYCEDCNDLLYPVNSAHFALYRDVRFHCIKEDCSSKHVEIYLTKCLYGECTEIIDSRVSKQCKHGMYICCNCGTCCSEDFFKRRLTSLQSVGGYIHPELIYNVDNKEGHLEKKEYYCFGCSGMMMEHGDGIYKCVECNVKYDLNKFKWLSKKWTNTFSRRKDYPTRLK